MALQPYFDVVVLVILMVPLHSHDRFAVPFRISLATPTIVGVVCAICAIAQLQHEMKARLTGQLAQPIAGTASVVVGIPAQQGGTVVQGMVAAQPAAAPMMMMTGPDGKMYMVPVQVRVCMCEATPSTACFGA